MKAGRWKSTWWLVCYYLKGVAAALGGWNYWEGIEDGRQQAMDNAKEALLYEGWTPPPEGW